MMRIKIHSFSRFIPGLCLVAVIGCTQMPTEKQSVVDMRAQISFSFDDDAMASARVKLDGIDMGSAYEYQEGKSSLRILPGTHRLTVINRGANIIDEKFYVGDGVSRSFNLK